MDGEKCAHSGNSNMFSNALLRSVLAGVRRGRSRVTNVELLELYRH